MPETQPYEPNFNDLRNLLLSGPEATEDVLRYLDELERSTKDTFYSISRDVLADRYATETRQIFSEKGKTKSERELWVAVMKAQREFGVDIPGEDITKYEAAINDIDLELIRDIERITKHDVKAKIQAFVKASGAKQHVHRGMTARDLTDNVEQMQIRRASELMLGRYVSVLYRMVDRAEMYRDILLTARSHHQPAQPTLLGRRISMSAEELMLHLPEFETFVAEYPLRGIKGPVGTQSDMLSLLGSPEKVEELEKRVAEYLGFSRTLGSVGQIYPRSLDSSLISKLSLLTSGCENFATNMRLMSGYELVTERLLCALKTACVGQVAQSYAKNKRTTRGQLSAIRACRCSDL